MTAALHHDVRTHHGLAAALLSSAVLLSACGTQLAGGTSGSGTPRTESRPVSGFSQVQLSTSGDVQIRQTGTESLSITADDNVLPLLTSNVVDGVLELGVKDNASFQTKQPITYQVTVNNLTGLDVAGSGSQSALDITATALRVRIAGSGSALVSGTADSQDIQIAGSGDYNGSALKSSTATVKSAGSGDVEVTVSTSLDVNLLGSGNITYSGSAQVTQSVLGSGTLTKK